MKRMIIIEGPDNIGKTTFANQLAKSIDGTVSHSIAPVKKGVMALIEQKNKLFRTIAALEEDAGPALEVCDRSVIGEAVYGPLYRTAQYDHDAYFSELKHLRLHDARILVIVLYADAQTFQQMKIRPKSDEKILYQQASQTQPIATAFVDVATKLRLKHTLFVNCNNYASFDERNAFISRRVDAWIKRKPWTFKRVNDYTETFFNDTQRVWVPTSGFSENSWECNAFEDVSCKIGAHQQTLKMWHGNEPTPISGVGATKSIKYIFVGEATGYNINGGKQLGMPFYNGESGCLFQRALSVLKIFPTQYYLTNVVKCNPKGNRLGEVVNRDSRHTLECVQHLHHEIEAKQKANPSAKVVAVGKVAAEELARLRVDHVMAYHPSYYLRIGRSDDFVTDLGKVVL